MSQLATITSKKQLTLPSKLFKKANLKIGQKVFVKEENGSLIITPAEKLVEDLAASIPIPQEWKGRDLDKIIEGSIEEYYTKKAS